MRNKAVVAIIVLGFALISGSQAKAQFSKAVVMLKGVVRSEQTGKAHSVKVSVRVTARVRVNLRAIHRDRADLDHPRPRAQGEHAAKQSGERV